MCETVEEPRTTRIMEDVKAADVNSKLHQLLEENSISKDPSALNPKKTRRGPDNCHDLLSARRNERTKKCPARRQSTQ